MITALLFISDSVINGVKELLTHWQTGPASSIWFDLTETAQFDETLWSLPDFKLHPDAIQDAQRDRHPDRVHCRLSTDSLEMNGMVIDILHNKSGR